MAFFNRHRPQLLGDSLTATGDGARYDREYFDKWYRHPRFRVKSTSELARQVRFVLAMSDWVLGRPTRNVLDVGSGEGQWNPALKRLRKSLYYEGIDPSSYAVERYGVKRNISLGDIETVRLRAQRTQYDLVVCCGMLNYLSPAQLTRGLEQVASVTGGMAYLELFTADDEFEGDTNWPRPRSAKWYRKILGNAGFTPIGMQCYVTHSTLPLVASLERFPE